MFITTLRQSRSPNASTRGCQPPIRSRWANSAASGSAPHPVPQFQIIFTRKLFAEVVPWMMLNRESLDILVHPLTNDMVDDHTIYALWLGDPVALILDHTQRRGYRDALLPASEHKAA
jgi:aromatic ring-cleaving dioxygenase